MARTSFSSTLFVGASLLTALALAACGGAGATTLPTPTPIPTYGFVQPTSVISATSEATVEADGTAEATAAASSLDAEVVAKGLGRYEALNCASCHGAAGEGTDTGPSLLASTQTEGEFFSFIRSGGALGTAHQYPSGKLSDSGSKSLYQYLLSLREGS